MKLKTSLQNLVLLIFLLLSISVYSQKEKEVFLKEVHEKNSDLTEEQIIKLQRIKKYKLHKNVKHVKVGKLPAIVEQNNGWLEFTVPGYDTVILTARPKRIIANSKKDYEWYGEFIENDGSITIIRTKGEIFGTIKANGRVFELHSIGNNKNILIENNIDDSTQFLCGNTENDIEFKGIPGKKTVQKTKSTSGYSYVRVLFLYTPAAANSGYDINNTVTQVITELNTAFLNSEIKSDVVVGSAGIQSFDFIENKYNIEDDVKNRLNNSLIAQNYRNDYYADLVVLLTYAGYVNNYGYDVYGRVSEFGPNDDKAYAIVEIDKAYSYGTVSHEAAHLFGTRHEKGQDDDPGFAHAFRFKTGTWPLRRKRETIMIAIHRPRRAINYYSNPVVKFKKKATGTSTANNARKLREEAGTVSDFRPPVILPPPSMTAAITGPFSGFEGQFYTWTAHAYNGREPYSYTWHYSYDGFSYKYIFGTGTNVTAYLPTNRDLYLRLTATDANNDQAMGYFVTRNMSIKLETKITKNIVITNEALSLKNGMLITEEKEYLLKNNEKAISVFPNPANETTTLQYVIKENSDVVIEIMDLQGRLIQRIENAEQGPGVYNYKLNLSNRSGMFIVRMNMNNEIITEKIIKE